MELLTVSSSSAALSSNPPDPSSRSPTPSPESRHGLAASRLSRGRQDVSAITTPAITNLAIPLRPRDEPASAAPSTKKPPIIAQPTLPSSSTLAGDARPGSPEARRGPRTPTIMDSSPEGHSAPAGARSLTQPLLADVSLYTNPQLSIEQESTSLEELAHLVRLSKYQERKRANTRTRLQRSLISTALSARLIRCGEMATRHLGDAFRYDDKRGFAGLFNAVCDVRNSCEATRRYALLDPEMDPLHSPAMASTDNLEAPGSDAGASNAAASSSVAPFLNEISASAREAFLDFLTQLRTNPEYLACRLGSLNTSELQALTSFHQGPERPESVLPGAGGRPSGHGHTTPTANRTSPHGTTAVERLLSFQRHDPLSTLIYTCFANSAGPDSAEDKRRTDIWANACARLVTGKDPKEHALVAILNVWSTMRDWSGRSNMEWFLMKILEDGAFLLERAEDPSGTRFNLSDWSPNDGIAAKKFYDKAVDLLFETLDDEDATGIPEGVIELGTAILRRLDSRLVEGTRRWFVYRWLFATWLPAVMTHPESHGMMAEYHITDYARQKILKAVIQHAQRYVFDLTAPWSNNRQEREPVPAKIKGHVENILRRFRPSRSQRTARLMPARSITSLRETTEVHPFLVVCPADLLTLVNALFPERRPLSAHSGSVRSAAPSISGFSAISQPISIATTRSNVETASILSMSASSVASEATTSREPLLDEQSVGTPQRYSPPMHDVAAQRRMTNYEDDGYRLRFAMQEMVQVLGSDVVGGSCHPCAEKWAVLFISSDGNNLSLNMTYDPDDDLEEESSSTTSDTEDEDPDEKPELDKDYHQLRDSILKLVEDFEIPHGLDDDGTKTTFSNRASSLKKYRSKNKILTPENSMASRNPYRKRDDSASTKSPGGHDEGTEDGDDKDSLNQDEAEPQSALITMLTAASSQTRVQSDFVSAHLYWRTLQQLNALASPSLRKNGFSTLLNIFSRGPRDSIRRSASAIEEYDAWLVWLKQSQERHEGFVESLMKRVKGVRDKMWYVTDVYHSVPYDDTRSLCSALKIMGQPSKWGTFQRNRAQLSRGSAAGYIFRRESQMLDLLAANEEQGGPNKLTDDQAEITLRWLEQNGVRKICHGEERVHRFCAEIDSCISKLISDNMTDSPVLWSSELYSRDKKSIMQPTRATRDSFVGFDDASSVISGDRYTTSSTRSKPVSRDLRNMYNMSSQLSVDSNRYSFSRPSAGMSDILDSHDYFGISSPVHAIDQSSTFWSPFQSTMPSAASATSRAQSPTTSVTNLSSTFSNQFGHSHFSSHQSSTGRPGTSASSNETIQQQRMSEEKQVFFADLRRTLTSLLLSDLGKLVFSRGSETDEWFNDLGQECIDRREATSDRRQRRAHTKKDRTSKNLAKQRLEKKKSFGNLRQAGETPAADVAGAEKEDGSTPGNDSSSAATSDTVSARSRPSSKDDTPDFPYKKAYQRLLRMFCIHPNPYVKLNALFELKQLVVASLSSGSRRAKWALRGLIPFGEDGVGTFTQTRQLEQTLDSMNDRQAGSFQSQLMQRSGGNAETRSVKSVKANNTTTPVVNVLQALFRDAGVRPKTLFRDLQYIEAFVSTAVPMDRGERDKNFEDTERGKTFFDAMLAAVSLKQEVCTTMVEIADEVVKTHTAPRKTSGGSDDSTEPSRPTSTHSLRDAAKMWTITAKEGFPTAQRELALFHLTHPELIERTTLPLSKPREVFKQTVMEKYGGGRPRTAGGDHRMRSTLGGSGGGLGGLGSSAMSSSSADGGMGDHHGLGNDAPGSMMEGDVRSDPALMCVTIHWMEAAEKGGDEVARTFVSQLT